MWFSLVLKLNWLLFTVYRWSSVVLYTYNSSCRLVNFLIQSIVNANNIFELHQGPNSNDSPSKEESFSNKWRITYLQTCIRANKTDAVCDLHQIIWVQRTSYRGEKEGKRTCLSTFVISSYCVSLFLMTSVINKI